MNSKQSAILAVAWIIAALLALPLLWMGTLGLFGRLADVSARENFWFGLQFLMIGLVPLAVMAVVQLAVRLFRD